jgi:hypothetical protein
MKRAQDTAVHRGDRLAALEAGVHGFVVRALAEDLVERKPDEPRRGRVAHDDATVPVVDRDPLFERGESGLERTQIADCVRALHERDPPTV